MRDAGYYGHRFVKRTWQAIFLGLLSAPVALAQAGNWVAKAPMRTGRCCAAAAAIDGIVYVVGGFADSVGSLATLEAYDPATNTWSEKAPMPTPRSYLAAAAVNGVLYAVGGENNLTGYVNTLEAYDPRTNLWTTKAPMPTARMGLAAATVGGKLFAIGGDKPNALLATVDAYDPMTNSWATMPPMPTARFYLAVASAFGSLYAVGGNDVAHGRINTLEVYEPTTGSWATGLPMPTPRDGLTAAVVGGDLYAIGGSDGGQYTTVEAYDPVTNSWMTAPSLSTGRHDLASAVVDDTIYAIGGLGYQCCIGSEPFLATNEAFSPFEMVKIDIKPGDPSNFINLKSNGVVPVAILGSATFDPMTVDPASVTLTAATDNGSGEPGGAPVATRGRGIPMTATADVNHDGYPDLILYFRTEDMTALASAEHSSALQPPGDGETPPLQSAGHRPALQQMEAVLYGKTYSGTPIRGSDTVRIVPAPKPGPGRFNPRHGLLHPGFRR
jgi:N-acetylneuraminic acid mutarotase